MTPLPLFVLFQIPAVGEGLDQVGSIEDVIRWSGVLMSILIIALVWLGLRVVDGILNRLEASFSQRRMLLSQGRALLHFSVYLGTVAVVILLSFHLSKPVLTFLGGTAAVALGFGFKDLLASFVGGITIMLDRPFQVGDRVTFGGYYGDVIAIGLRSVRLQTLDDNTVTIPNNVFFTDVTSSANYGQIDMMTVIDFHVGADQDVRRAREIVREAAITSRYIHLEKDVVVLVEQVVLENAVAARIRLKGYVLDTHFEKAMETDITLRVLEGFAAENVAPPAVLHRSTEAPKSVSG